MAKAVVVSWPTESQVLVNGSMYTQYQVKLSGDNEHSALVPLGMTTHRFESVEPGVYIGTVTLLNDDGSLVGPGFESDPTEIFDDATLEVPIAVNIVVEPLA